MEYLQYFFNPQHLFAIWPSPIQPRALLILGILFGAMIVVGAVVRWLLKTQSGLLRRTYQKLGNLLITIGVLGGVYMFFAWQRVALLGSRFWLVVLALIVLIRGIFIIKYIMLDLPKKQVERKKRQEFEKYLP